LIVLCVTCTACMLICIDAGMHTLLEDLSIKDKSRKQLHMQTPMQTPFYI
jgi:Fe-S-cluster-containing dehydrogenase component